jgi:fumarate reductase subunit D
MVVRRQLEPFLWAVFSVGGVLAALFIPALVLLFGLLFPLRLLAPPGHAHLLAVVAHPVTRLTLFTLIALSFFHGGHRFRYTLYDGLQIKHLNEVVRLFCYGGAIVGSAAAAYILWTVP